jgi:hypothetical protein
MQVIVGAWLMTSNGPRQTCHRVSLEARSCFFIADQNRVAIHSGEPKSLLRSLNGCNRPTVAIVAAFPGVPSDGRAIAIFVNMRDRWPQSHGIKQQQRQPGARGRTKSIAALADRKTPAVRPSVR